MPASKLIRTKGATIAVTANAEVLFMPGGQVYGWTRRLANAVKRGTEAEAPTNKRPRWGHYGKPLKSTMSSRVFKPRSGRHSGLRVYAAVGSSAPHAAYVDQGTGVFNGSSPWKAKILPPYAEGSSSLYEHTWHPPGQTANHTVMIKGQPGQFFFDKGLQRGFQQMRMRSYQRPGLDPRMGDILRTWPRELENFAGNTPADVAFMASLTKWRAWRDEAFNAERELGNLSIKRSLVAGRRGEYARRLRRNLRVNGGLESRLRRAQLSRIRSQIRRDKIKAAKSLQKPKPKPAGRLTRANDKLRVKALATKRLKTMGPGAVIDSITWDNGRWQVVIKTFEADAGGGRKRPRFRSFHVRALSV